MVSFLSFKYLSSFLFSPSLASLQSFFSYPPEGMGFGPFGLGGGRGTFCDTFKCYSMVFFSNATEDADHGGKSEKYF